MPYRQCANIVSCITAQLLSQMKRFIFDVFKTYYYLSYSDTVDCLMNIYFDLYEMERLAMMEKLKTHDFTKVQAAKIYKKTQTKLYIISKKYFQEIDISPIFGLV